MGLGWRGAGRDVGGWICVLRRVREGEFLERDYRAASGEVARSLWVYIAFAALGGLILNLMPCVLPVISLKVLGFVNQAGEETKRVQQLGVGVLRRDCGHFFGTGASGALSQKQW